LKEYGVYNENGLVEIPQNLSYREAATLPRAGLTAWNALYGGKAFWPGDTVLTQGTGGVSIFAAQFALAGGAEVIATTSSVAKGEILRELGVHHIINYKEDENWGETAKKASIGQRGADYVVEIGDPIRWYSLPQLPRLMEHWRLLGLEPDIIPRAPRLLTATLFSTRRIMVGSRLQFEEMNRAIVANNIKPTVG
jgi:NADPH:quinone reductase-like Zn-dependent oxidoreductase